MNTYFKIILTAAISLSCTAPKSEKEAGSTSNPVEDAVEILEQSAIDTIKGSIRAKASGRIGDANIVIRYHSPAVRGRILWGGLVPFDKIWVTGAHMATSIEFDRDVSIDGKPVTAGKYALFTIPGKDGWTVVINSNWQQHLTDEYDPKDDVLRFETKPEKESTHQERLRFVVESESSNEGELVVYWEQLEVSIPIKTLR
jgi:hypothetical protein